MVVIASNSIAFLRLPSALIRGDDQSIKSLMFTVELTSPSFRLIV